MLIDLLETFRCRFNVYFDDIVFLFLHFFFKEAFIDIIPYSPKTCHNVSKFVDFVNLHVLVSLDTSASFQTLCSKYC